MFASKFHRTSTKNLQKDRETQHVPQNPIKKRSLGHPFSLKTVFLIDLGVPEGIQKLVKMGGGH